MAEEEQRDLLGNQSESVVSIEGEERRSCGSGSKWAAISIFVALLIAGQAATIYFVVQQQGQITTLQTHTVYLQQELKKKPTGPVAPPKKLRMAMFQMPLAFSEDLVEKPGEKKPDPKNMTLDEQVQYFLKKWNPGTSFPQLEKTFLENLNQMKLKMTLPDWMAFESWMRQWLLFQQAQKNKDGAPTPGPTSVIEAAVIQTKCQLESSGVPSVHPGMFKPQCDEQGDYLPKQCYSSTGYCWCVDKNGTKIPGTEQRGPVNCTRSGEPMLGNLEENMLKMSPAV